MCCSLPAELMLSFQQQGLMEHERCHYEDEIQCLMSPFVGL
jgi:hypothetical protein